MILRHTIAGMRYRDCPTVEVSEHIAGDPAALWAAVCDITLPVGFSPELRRVEWLDGADRVAVGARFRGHNKNNAIGEWHTDCRIVEVEDGARWVWAVGNEDAPATTWGFEVDPTGDSTIVRQWARIGPGPSGLSAVIATMPDKEARIIDRRLADFAAGIRANLAGIKAAIER